MKKTSSRVFGNILIALGTVIILLTIYDAARPYFPDRSPYEFLEKLKNNLIERRPLYSLRLKTEPQPTPSTSPTR